MLMTISHVMLTNTPHSLLDSESNPLPIFQSNSLRKHKAAMDLAAQHVTRFMPVHNQSSL